MSMYKDRLLNRFKKEKKLYSNKNRYDNQTITVKMMITNLDTQEDYDILKNSLLELDGVDDIDSFKEKQINVSYDQSRISLEQIVYKVTIMGYRYINRF